MSYFIRNSNTYRVASKESLDIHETLPVGNYTVLVDQNGNFYLEMIDGFKPASKMYGNTQSRADRILATFDSRPSTTGVMLTGEKGSGKTLLAKTISIEGAKRGIPTLIINQPWVGDKFNKFLQDIEQQCIILFDEFEKVYDADDQEHALTLLDGVFPARKLFILTCNDKWRVNQHMRNRPGRIFYMLEFQGLDPEFIREYCEDNLANTQHIEKIVVIAAMFDQFNFDMLKALVEEMNRYNETPQEALQMLNVKPEFSNDVRFDIQMLINDVPVEAEKLHDETWHGNPLTDYIHVAYSQSKAVAISTPSKVSDNSGLRVVELASNRAAELRKSRRPRQHTDDDYEQEITVRTTFTPADIIHVDPSGRRFVYKNADGEHMVLTRSEKAKFNYMAF